MKFKYVSLVLVVVLIGVFFFLNQKEDSHDSGLLGDVHEHADFAVYLNDVRVDFNQSKYMSTSDNVISNFVHVHDGNGEVIHKHSTGITLGFFFNSLGIKFNSSCFVIDDSSYCNSDSSKLEMYINGELNTEFDSYEFSDLDRILITYGSSDVSSEISSVTDKACIQSEKCPERGSPSDESSCLGSGDCLA